MSAVIRISGLQLPLDYTPESLRAAIVGRMAIVEADLLDFTLFKRGHDARRKNSAVVFVCIIDAAVPDEASVLRRFAHDRQVEVAPDTAYHPVARAPATLRERPLVVGFGPAGLFAALLLA